MADLSKIKVNGVTYDIKDATARQAIESLQAVKHYIGTTTTELADGAETNPVTISGKSVTAVSGQVAIYGKKEFLFADDNAWHEFGDVSGLKKLAYKDSVEATYTPAGTIKGGAFTGASMTSTGTVKIPTSTTAGAFKGTEANLSVSGKSDGTVTVSTAAVPTDGTATYTPAGSVGVTPTKATIKEVASTGTLASLTQTVTDETLEISFNAGALPTTKDTSVMTGASASFTGTGTLINASFDGKNVTSTGKYTPAGTVDAPTLNTTDTTVTVTGTTKGSVTEVSFEGTQATIASE